MHNIWSKSYCSLDVCIYKLLRIEPGLKLTETGVGFPDWDHNDVGGLGLKHLGSHQTMGERSVGFC